MSREVSYGFTPVNIQKPGKLSVQFFYVYQGPYIGRGTLKNAPSPAKEACPLFVLFIFSNFR